MSPLEESTSSHPQSVASPVLTVKSLHAVFGTSEHSECELHLLNIKSSGISQEVAAQPLLRASKHFIITINAHVLRNIFIFLIN